MRANACCYVVPVNGQRLVPVVIAAASVFACNDSADKRSATAEQEAVWAAEDARFRDQVENAWQHGQAVVDRLSQGYPVALKSIADGSAAK